MNQSVVNNPVRTMPMFFNKSPIICPNCNCNVAPAIYSLRQQADEFYKSDDTQTTDVATKECVREIAPEPGEKLSFDMQTQAIYSHEAYDDMITERKRELEKQISDLEYEIKRLQRSLESYPNHCDLQRRYNSACAKLEAAKTELARL